MNMLKTTVLLATLTGLLVAIGGLVGGVGGAVIFLVIAGAMNFFAYWFSDKFALRMAGARQIEERDDPRLFALVREVAERSRMPMPKVYIINNPSPNAFATGRNPQNAVVAVTTGIQSLLTERELRGVIGHEMGHVRNRDILTSSIVATVAGAISMIAQVLMWSSIFGGSRGRGQHPLVTLAVILIAPIAATLIQLGISRTREYSADRTGAEVTGDPEGGGGMANLFSTHPPLEERIRRLRSMRY
ncbi:MAG TPA: M48 family metalloprotease [Tepidiformaceae bacterium]|nr:M48 family metalloprotease [Tepidiformaceae bacterium]